MKKQPIVILEIGIIMMSIYGQGLFGLIHTNAREIVESRVEARRNYLESIMVNQWMNLGQTVQKINQLADGLVEAGKLDIEAIDDSSENAAPFLNAVSDDLISMMRTNRVTGVFLILNADNLQSGMESGTYEDKPGLYFRDLDPESRPSNKNMDLLIERSPLLEKRERQSVIPCRCDCRMEEFTVFWEWIYCSVICKAIFRKRSWIAAEPHSTF